MGATEKVAQFIVDFDYSKLPPKAIESIKSSVADTIGTALLASAGPAAPIMTGFIAEDAVSNPQARVVGNGMKTSVLDAALVNGTYAHFDDYDDVGGFGHPGVVLVPPALALGEYLKLSGKKLFEAYAVGFEVGTKLNGSIGEIQMDGGFHSTGLLGTMAATATAAKLLDLDVAQTRAALGIAASLAGGIMQSCGTYTKGLHAGQAARSGLLAGMLAKRGFTGDPDVFEGSRGFFVVYGKEQADIRRLTENIGKPIAIGEVNLIFKIWPCCHGNHAPLTAMFRLIEKYDVKPEQVEQVEVIRSRRPPGPLIRYNPQIGFEGKFSQQFNMATALVDRKVDMESYTDEKLARPMIQDLMKRVKVTHHPDYVGLPPSLQNQPPFCIIKITLKDGRVISEREAGGRMLKGEEVYNKYRENAKVAGIDAAKMERSVELIKGLENVEDLTRLMDVVTR